MNRRIYALLFPGLLGGLLTLIAAAPAPSSRSAAFDSPTAGARSQTPGEFEVASVRQNLLDDRIVTIDVGPGGKFSARGYTLVLLVQRAYGVMGWNVSGGPPWIREDRFDVNARASISGNLTEQQLQPMLQKLLADRFKLKLHRTTQEMAGYALVVVPGSAPGGAPSGKKLRASSETQANRDNFRFNNTGLSGQGISMADFARFVAGKLGLVAVDQTGLTGVYDVKADWRVETDQLAAAAGADPKEALRLAVFSALQEQLGLKFVWKRIPVQTLVVESAEKASGAEN